MAESPPPRIVDTNSEVGLTVSLLIRCHLTYDQRRQARFLCSTEFRITSCGSGVTPERNINWVSYIVPPPKHGGGTPFFQQRKETRGVLGLPNLGLSWSGAGGRSRPATVRANALNNTNHTHAEVSPGSSPERRSAAYSQCDGAFFLLITRLLCGFAHRLGSWLNV